MAMHYAGCCNPIPGDPIIGIINTGTGVTIHSQICHNLKNLVLLPQRVLDVCWKNDDEIGDELYASRVRVLVENKSGKVGGVVKNTFTKKKKKKKKKRRCCCYTNHKKKKKKKKHPPKQTQTPFIFFFLSKWWLKPPPSLPLL